MLCCDVLLSSWLSAVSESSTRRDSTLTIAGVGSVPSSIKKHFSSFQHVCHLIIDSPKSMIGENKNNMILSGNDLKKCLKILGPRLQTLSITHPE